MTAIVHRDGRRYGLAVGGSKRHHLIAFLCAMVKDSEIDSFEIYKKGKLLIRGKFSEED